MVNIIVYIELKNLVHFLIYLFSLSIENTFFHLFNNRGRKTMTYPSYCVIMTVRKIVANKLWNFAFQAFALHHSFGL